MFILNSRAVRAAYPTDLHEVMSVSRARQSREWLSKWSGLNPGPTPLHPLPGLATSLGVAGVLLKDESVRSPLGSFKALGAPIALVRLVLRAWSAEGWSAEDLFAGKHADALRNFVVISATDGNHGRALAAAARSIGCQCVIVLHANVSQEREEAIAEFGAQIVRITGDYDASVAEAARLAHEHDWQVVSDTSYDGYEEVPRDVMQGYGVIAEEALEACASKHARITHVVVQGGVGGLAAGVISYIWETFCESRPTFIVVEPEQADCLFQSAIQVCPARASGSVDSVMAGLACGETSPLAWRFLEPAVDVFITIPDELAEVAMRRLADGADGDIPIVSGESGAAGLAGLEVLCADDNWRRSAKITDESCILLINTEGATAPSVYQELVGRAESAVRSAQMDWGRSTTC